jgi:7-dehydrocholesterol reductase
MRDTPRDTSGWGVVHTTLAPLALLAICPPFAMILFYTHLEKGGSIAAALAEGPALLARAWGAHALGSPVAWATIVGFAAVELALMRLVPGRRWEGPVTPAGHVPVYVANGPACFAITLAAASGLVAGGVLPGSHLYDHALDILGALNLAALVLCLGLYVKGRVAPSGPDHGATGNPVFDYYWGTELYPRILGFDVKQFTNCRFGMTGWALWLLSYAAAQAPLSATMGVAVGIQLVYIAKFFWWEDGYLRSIDIMHDRAGFYICWGCLVWIPAVYTGGTMYLVDHPVSLPPAVTVLWIAAGIGAVMANYLADAQRQHVRTTGGKGPVWGKPPVLIRARYTTGDGAQRENLLLASGWWGIARHFHYIPELAAAYLWTAPVGLSHALPWLYPVFLTALLVHRAMRDDERCARKYGPDWEAYCAVVRWKMLPGVW